MTKQETLNKIFKDNGLIAEDVFKHQHYTIITRAGIDKIQANKGSSFKDGSTNTYYVVEMAEKRAMSRAVLKLAGLYSLGVFGEDESESFKK